jgi:hypothetical protein
MTKGALNPEYSVQKITSQNPAEQLGIIEYSDLLTRFNCALACPLTYYLPSNSHHFFFDCRTASGILKVGIHQAYLSTHFMT